MWLVSSIPIELSLPGYGRDEGALLLRFVELHPVRSQIHGIWVGRSGIMDQYDTYIYVPFDAAPGANLRQMV